MITNLKLSKLYNLYSYDIDFTNDPNIQIITGPNGFGKTTILQVINHFCTGRLWYFYYLPFEQIDFTFSNNKSFSIKKTDKIEKATREDVILIFQMFDDKQAVETCEFKASYLYLQLRNINLYRGRFTEGLREDDFLEEFYELEKDEEINSMLPNYIEFLKSEKCVIVEEQRLTTKKTVHASSATIKTVEEIQNKINEFFAQAIKTYNQESLKIDGSFVKRLSDLKVNDNEGQLKHIKKERIYKDVTRIIKNYQKYGLVKELNVVPDLGVHYVEVLKLYLKDLHTKLMSINDYYKKLSLFDRLVSGKSLSYKNLVFEDDKFFIKNDANEEVPIHKLSSGEQNLLILCYNLVFELKDNSILLLDEPENSLHMAWLNNLLNDYIDIAQLTGCQMIIATHSPAFIHGNWKLTYDLCENEKIHNT